MDISRRKLVALGILSLIPIYLLLLVSLPQNTSLVCDQANASETRGFTDKVGFCTQIGFSLVRPYYFGLMELPVYKLGINLHIVNKYFIPVLSIAAVLVWREYI